jgi:hypothetical protein
MESIVHADIITDDIVENNDFQRTFQFRPLTICPLPLRITDKNKMSWESKNGPMTVRMLADDKYGLPKGRDILVILWLIYKCMQNGDKFIKNARINDYLRFYGLNNGKKTREEAKERFLRIINTRWHWSGLDGDPAYGLTKIDIVKKCRLYFSDDDSIDPVSEEKGVEEEGGETFALKPQKAMGEEFILVSDEFYQTVVDSKIPYNINTVRKIQSAPFLLSLYLFLNWRAHYAWKRHLSGDETPLEIPLFGNNGLKKQLSSTNNSNDRAFKAYLFEQVDILKKHWENCPVSYVPAVSNRDRSMNKEYKDVLSIKVTSIDQLDVQPDLNINIARTLKKKKR